MATFLLTLCSMALIITAVNAQDPLSAGAASNSAAFTKAIFIDAAGPELAQRNSALQAITKVRDAGFDTIVLQVRHLGELFYTSSLEPKSLRLDTTFSDPLGEYVAASHDLDMSKNIRVIAWISCFPAHSGMISPVAAEGNVMRVFPQWTNMNINGEKSDARGIFHLDPAIPAVQEYLGAVIADMVSRYNVDGVLLDDFRYPDDGLNWGYNNLALQAFSRDTGAIVKPLPHDPAWCDWRRNQLTAALGNITRKIKTAKPGIPVYVNANTWGKAPVSPEDFKNTFAYSLVLQNWQGWVKDGIVDGVILDNYRQYPDQEEEYLDWLDFAENAIGKDKAITGVGGFFNFTNAVSKQIRSAREKSMAGVALYCYRAPCFDNSTLLFGSLKNSVFAPSLISIRRSGIRSEATPTPRIEDQPSTPTLNDQATTATLPVSTPAAPREIILPAIPNLPSLPNLAVMITPTPVVTPAPPLPESTPAAEATAASPPVAPVPPAPAVQAAPTPRATPKPALPLPEWDSIHLKNGSIIKGRVLDEVEGKATVETSQGFMMTINVEDILKVVKYR